MNESADTQNNNNNNPVICMYIQLVMLHTLQFNSLYAFNINNKNKSLSIYT